MSLPVCKVAILGFGTVGKGVYDGIHSHKDFLEEIVGREIEIVAVLIKNDRKSRAIDSGVLVTTDFNDILAIPDLSVVIEAIVGVEPGFNYLRKAIEKGCHIVTANKVMFAHNGRLLEELARKEGVHLGFEATTAGGIPIIGTISKLLKANRITKIAGILNGTSNYILTKMKHQNSSFEKALSEAQERGYAESDPSADIEGHDALFKLMILSQHIYGEQPIWETVETKGINKIEAEWFEFAETEQFTIKHVASLEKTSEEWLASVRPVLCHHSHPFSQINGVENGVKLEGSLVGSLLLQGAGAGALPTASAVIEDLVACLTEPIQDKRAIPALNDRVEMDVKSRWIFTTIASQSSLALPNSLILRRTIQVGEHRYFYIEGTWKNWFSFIDSVPFVNWLEVLTEEKAIVQDDVVIPSYIK
jgi:homoserine dehydrogenase